MAVRGADGRFISGGASGGSKGGASGFYPPLQDNDIRKRWSQAVRKTVLEAHRRIVLKTPVDSGHARMNWYPTVGERDFTVIDGGGMPDMNPSMDEARLQNFEPVFEQNNVPYIGPLEYGHSQQAPEGMVRVTIAEMLG